MRSRPARVLRVADVIPPFGANPSPRGEGDAGVKPPAARPVPAGQAKAERKVRPAQTTRSENEVAARLEQAVHPRVEIPKYNLAENILAAHRRTAATRRKAPGRTPVESQAPASRPEALPGPVGIRGPVSEPSSPDLLELRRIVAEIVARDIERLCPRPSRSLCA